MDLKLAHLVRPGESNHQPRFSDATDFLNFSRDPFKVMVRILPEKPGPRPCRMLSEEFDAIAD
jgi:hypothetical protein